ncbi:MAG: DUF2271 domain-containing protein [Paracoccaceae bacterium]
MNTALKVASLVAALSLGSPVSAAKALSITTAMASYNGNRAYAVVYIVDSRGKYIGTIYAAGQRAKYFSHMSRWHRMFSRSGRGVDGTTGASVGSGQSFSTTMNIPDTLINAGYVLRIETVVENQRYFPKDVSIPIDNAHNGKIVFGNGYVDTAIIKY